MKAKNALLLLSGGLDSSTLLAKYSHNIRACAFIDYGSRQNAREKQAAFAVASRYMRELIVLDFRGVFEAFNSALLLHSKDDIKDGEYKDGNTSAVVPFRNGIFISALTGLAESLGCDGVCIGVHSSDWECYADCRPSFIKLMRKTIWAYNKGITLETPFLNINKAQIAKKAIRADLDVSLTYSCYRGGEFHCGTCPTCIERKSALGIADTTIYERG